MVAFINGLLLGCFAVVSFTSGMGWGHKHQHDSWLCGHHSFLVAEGGNSVRLLFSLSVLETSALGRWHPSPLNHHTHPGGGGRGQHAEGSLWSPALTAALRILTPLETDQLSGPGARVHDTCLRPPAAHKALWLSVWAPSSFQASLAHTQLLAPQTFSN